LEGLTNNESVKNLPERPVNDVAELYTFMPASSSPKEKPFLAPQAAAQRSGARQDTRYDSRAVIDYPQKVTFT
jgi:hypothetical protein